MKPITTSGYTFSKFAEGGFLYVDKTRGIHDLLRPAFGQYFLARPRRFGKSLLNNLNDLTMDARTATLLGYTQAELEGNFAEYIAALAAAIGKSRDATLTELREWYNGYRFHSDTETVYNVVKTKTEVFVFEFKLGGTARKAMEQIREKRYFERFLGDGRRITLVGVGFSKKTRNLSRWLIEPV